MEKGGRIQLGGSFHSYGSLTYTLKVMYLSVGAILI